MGTCIMPGDGITLNTTLLYEKRWENIKVKIVK